MLKKWLYLISDKLGNIFQRNLSADNRVYVVSVIIGLLCGIGAGLLKNGVDFVTHQIFSHFQIHNVNLLFFLLPFIGIFIATIWTVYVTRQPMDHASDRIVQFINTNQCDIKPRLMLAPIITCSITLGMGGSAGAEDPITYTGAAVGSNVAKLFRIPQEQMANLVGCGAAAAIGGIFMAPIGGVMFALEVLKMRQNLNTILAIVLSSLIAALTCYIMLGCHTDVTFVPEMRFDLHLIPWVLACGVVCGIYSVYYSSIMIFCRKFFNGISNRWLKALTGSAILATLLALFPSLYGEGYNIIRDLMQNEALSVVNYGPFYHLGQDFDWLLILFGVVLLVKPIATSATNDSGGVGGGFTPTFFCGGILGYLFAIFINHFFGYHLPYAIFAYFGMAAVMAGAISAPLMAIFIASEITGLYGFILPLTLAALASYLTSCALQNPKILSIIHEIR